MLGRMCSFFPLHRQATAVSGQHPVERKSLLNFTGEPLGWGAPRPWLRQFSKINGLTNLMAQMCHYKLNTRLCTKIVLSASSGKRFLLCMHQLAASALHLFGRRQCANSAAAAQTVRLDVALEQGQRLVHIREDHWRGSYEARAWGQNSLVPNLSNYEKC